MPGKRAKEKSVLSRQDIVTRRKQLQEQKLKTPTTGRRAIAGVVLLSASILSFLAVASFDAHDRVGPGFQNLIGPVGHALAEALRGFLGICALVLPVAGVYASMLIFVGDKETRRWPQLVCLALLCVSGAVLAQLAFKEDLTWAHAPGGLVGRKLATLLTGLFSTVGTIVLVSAISSVALIIGTQFAFLRFCAWFGHVAKVAAVKMWEKASALVASQRIALTQKWKERQAEAHEEARFISDLERRGSELDDMEQTVAEAEAIAEENARLQREAEAARAAKQAEKDARQREREARMRAREMGKAPPPAAEPAWTQGLAQTVISEPKKQPAIIESPVAPPAPPPEAFAVSMPPPSQATASVAPAVATLATVPAPSAAGAAALSHTPVIVEPKAPPKPSKKKEEQSNFEFLGGHTGFSAPSLDVLEMTKHVKSDIDKDAYYETAGKLVEKLKSFGIDGEVKEIRPGPVVTMYEFVPAAGIKISRIASLSDDLAMAMEALKVRIIAPIPGKGVVGIEVPNKKRETVFLKEIAEQDAFQKSAGRLTLCVGKDIEGMPYVLDLAKSPHLLMAGTTGSGKSVAVNSMIMSVLLKCTPEEVRFIMIDPKMLELSVYDGIPHLLLPVVTDSRKASLALQWAVDEMLRRYRLLAEAGVRNITSYNQQVDADKVKPKATPKKAETPVAPKKGRKLLIVDVEGDAPAAPAEAAPGEASLGVPSPNAVLDDPREGLSALVAAGLAEATSDGEIRIEDAPTPEEQAALEAAATAEAALEDAPAERKKLPYIVVIIDELADLMMVAAKEVETSIARLAQMARAAGIHLMVATQRPSVDVVTGLIKSNFPTRISFMLKSKFDSMTILGVNGAETLLGNGDMLILPPTSANLQRVHGAFVSDAEINRAVNHWKAQGKPVYDENITKPREEDAEVGGDDDGGRVDEQYDKALAIVATMETISVSMLQRKMGIGYNRAARMIERMEKEGVVSAPNGAKPRDVLIRGLGQMPGADAMA